MDHGGGGLRRHACPRRQADLRPAAPGRYDANALPRDVLRSQPARRRQPRERGLFTYRRSATRDIPPWREGPSHQAQEADAPDPGPRTAGGADPATWAGTAQARPDSVGKRSAGPARRRPDHASRCTIAAIPTTTITARSTGGGSRRPTLAPIRPPISE